MEQEKKGNTVFLSVIGIATLLVAIIGATFAWFSATVTGNDQASSVTVTTATLGINYVNGQEIKMLKAMPGATSGDKTFTIASQNATVNTGYTINWNIDTFDFVNKADLVYSLSGQKTSTAGTLVATKTDEAMPTSTGTTAIGNGTLSVVDDGAGNYTQDTHTYTLSVKFKETGSNQNSNQGKSFYGRIQVTTPEVSA